MDTQRATKAQVTTAAAYERVSLDRFNNGRSVNEQQGENDRAAFDNGWTIAFRYQDPDRSASRYATKPREEFQRLMTDLGRSAFGVLILWESSRGSRQLGEWITMLDLCREHGVLIHVTSEDRTYDVRKSSDRSYLASSGVDSERESGKTSERLQRYRRSAAEQGVPQGMIPFGYQRRYDEHTRELIAQEPHPEHAPIVREIFERFARAESLRAVRDDLNARGVPSPSGDKWGYSSLRAILKRRVYIAERDYNGEIYAVNCPALVSDEDWHTTQRIMADPARKTTKPGKAKYMLSWIAMCGKCGEPMHSKIMRKTGPRYSCEHGHYTIRRDWADEIMTADLATRLCDEKFLARLAARSETSEQADEARGELAKLRARLNELRDSAADVDGISPAMLARSERQLEPQIAAAEKRVAELSTPPTLARLLGDNPPTDRGVMYKRLVKLPMAQRRELVKLLTEKVTIGPAISKRPTKPEPKRIMINWKV